VGNSLMVTDAGAVVVGAGAFGVSAAYHLAKLGLEGVVLVDRFTPGSQASLRAAGLFKLIQVDETRTRLARLSVEKVVGFEAETGVPLQVGRTGSLMVARTPEHAQMVRDEAEHSAAWGVNLELVDGAEAARLTPILEADDIVAAAHIPGDIYVEEPISLVEAYLEAGRRAGVTALSNTRVTGIQLRDGRVSAVTTERGEIRTPLVVDAAGAWSRAVAELASVWNPVAPVRHQLFITKPIAAVDAGATFVRILDQAVYVRPARGGLMAGGFESAPLPLDPRHEGPEFTMDDMPLDLAVVRDVVGTVDRNVPLLRNVELDEHRGGLFTMTPDGRFLVGPVPEVEGFWLATGCNGSGFSFSPALGQMLAEWILEGEPSIDLSSLAPARFGRTFSDEELVAAGVWQYVNYYTPVSAPS
jgi:glycine/D-amino acid oxidase-like deaminating enzyme